MVHFLGTSSSGPVGPIGATGPAGDLTALESKTQNQSATPSVTTFTDSVVIGDGNATTDVSVAMKVADAEWTERVDYATTGRPWKLARTGLGDVITASSTGDVTLRGSITLPGDLWMMEGTLRAQSLDLAGGFVTIDSDAHIVGELTCGNLTVNGTTTTVNSTTVEVADATLHTARGNPGDTIDSAYYMEYKDGGNLVKYAGLVRDATDKKFNLFKELDSAPIAGTDYSTKLADLKVETLSANTVFVNNNLYVDAGLYTLNLSVSGVDLKARDAISVVNNGGVVADHSITRYNGTTGKDIQGSGIVVDDSNNVTGVVNLAVGGSLTMNGATSAFTPPKLTLSQIYALTPIFGMTAYNTTTNNLVFYDGTNWKSLTNTFYFNFSLTTWNYVKGYVAEYLNTINTNPGTPIQGALTVTALVASAYRGCAYSPVSNRVYLGPYGISNTTTWHYYDCATDTIGSYTALAGIQVNAYSGCAYDSVNDRVYLCPRSNTTATWHYIDCGTNTVVAYTGTALAANIHEGCVYSPLNQRVYLIPSGNASGTWYYINCTTPAAVAYTAVALPVNTYYGGTYCPVNDRIYMAMFAGSQTRTTLHYINCSNATIGSFTISAIGGAGSAFNGCIYSPVNNRIYMCPNSNNTLWYYINCNTDTLVSYTGLLVGNFYYWGGSYSPTDDRIYLCPQQNTSTTWHYINCSTNTIGSYTVPTKPINSFYGSSYCPVNNKIYLSPFVASNTTTWNTINNITTTESPNVNLMSGAMFGSSV